MKITKSTFIKPVGIVVFAMTLGASPASAQLGAILNNSGNPAALIVGDAGFFGPVTPAQSLQPLRDLGALPVSDIDEPAPGEPQGSGNLLNDALESLNGGGENTEPLTSLLPPVDVRSTLSGLAP